MSKLHNKVTKLLVEMARKESRDKGTEIELDINHGKERVVVQFVKGTITIQ